MTPPSRHLNRKRERARQRIDSREILASALRADDKAGNDDGELGRSSSPINKAACRQMIFNRLEVLRPALKNKMTRVSESSFEFLEARVRNIIDDSLRRMSTVGSTIYLNRV